MMSAYCTGMRVVPRAGASSQAKIKALENGLLEDKPISPVRCRSQVRGGTLGAPLKCPAPKHCGATWFEADEKRRRSARPERGFRFM
jgi:hypothetical protein